MERAIVYYTDSRLDKDLDVAVRAQLLKAAGDIPIISVSQKPLDFGKNICVGEKPASYRSIYEQILVGLEQTQASIINLCEHDVFYDKSHFEFIPTYTDRIYFNLNRYYWKRGFETFGFTFGRRAPSQAVADRELFYDSVKKHINHGEVGPHINVRLENWWSFYPNIDIRHDNNFSQGKVLTTYLSGATTGPKSVPGWGTTDEFSKAVKY